MGRLEDIPLETLRAELNTFEDRRPMLRLLAAILYKQGPSVPTIAAWFDVRPATVYAWFDRIEDAGTLEDALRDAPRPGRPARLSADDRAELVEILRGTPDAAGYDDAAWTPRTVAGLLQERFGVSYSLRHVRRLMDEADTG
jgi:transposase